MQRPAIDPEVFAQLRRRNRWHGALLIAALAAILALCGFLLSGWVGIAWALGFGVVLVWFGPRLSPGMTLRIYGARQLDRHEADRLYAVTDELARRAGLAHPPRLWYALGRTMNAFAVGTRDNAAIVVSDGLLRGLGLREVAAVLAHEIAHIAANDMWVMALADTAGRLTKAMALAGLLLFALSAPGLMLERLVTPWLLVLVLVLAPTAMLGLQLALSRNREFAADLEAVRMTHDPEGLARALSHVDWEQERLLSYLFGRRRNRQPSALRTHPRTEERIARLRALQPADGYDPFFQRL